MNHRILFILDLSNSQSSVPKIVTIVKVVINKVPVREVNIDQKKVK